MLQPYWPEPLMPNYRSGRVGFLVLSTHACANQRAGVFHAGVQTGG